MRRRDFLLAGVGSVAGFSIARLAAQSGPALGHIGVQLYTLRNMAKADLARTLGAVARAGYGEVEFAGYHGHPAPRVRRMLDDNGLVSPAAHVSLDELNRASDDLFEGAVILGQKYVVVPWIDAKDRTPDGYRRLAQRLNELGVRARGENLRLAYHNHAYEFTQLPGGRSGYQILLEEVEAANLVMEIDVFWMQQALQDPMTWLTRNPGRFYLMHVKDMGPPPGNEMADVGAGTTNWTAMIPAGKRAGVKHFFVEHDEPKNPLESIDRSYRYLRSLRT